MVKPDNGGIKLGQSSSESIMQLDLRSSLRVWIYHVGRNECGYTTLVETSVDIPRW